MKILFFILLLQSFYSYSATQLESDVRVTFEDDLNTARSDYDGNDVVMCMTNSFETDVNGKVKTVVLSITPEAAGATYTNALYIKNPCEGNGTIVFKSTDDSCSSLPVTTSVTTNGELVLFVDSFTRNAFSSQCGSSSMVNINDESSLCLPNRTFVKIYCDSSATFSLNADSTFPYAKLFYLDPLGNGTSGSDSSDDVHIDSIFNGLSLINVGTCSDPVPEERTNFIDALDLRSTIDTSKCLSDANLCRSEIKAAMITKRSGWPTNENVKSRKIPRNAPSDTFSTRSFVLDYQSILTQDQTANPIFENQAACEGVNNKPTYIETPSLEALYSKTVTITNDSGVSGTNINVLIKFNSQTLISAGKMNSDCSDVFVQQSGANINHWIAEGSCNTATTMLWVLVPVINLTTTEIMMYYGDLGKTNTSNGFTTFPVYFDDFNRSSNVWTHPNLGNYTEINRTTGNFHGLSISGGYLIEASPSSYADLAGININRPNDNYFSLVQKIKFTKAGSDAIVSYYAGNQFAFFNGTTYAQSNLEGFDMRTSGYDTKYYTFAGASTWLNGSGAYTQNIDYVVDYNYKKTAGGYTGTISRICILGCNYNTVVNQPSTVPSGSVNIAIGGGYDLYASQHDYVMYTKNMRTPLSVSVGSESSL